MKDQFISVVDTTEFNKRIMDCITSGEIDKYIDNTVFAGKDEYKQAIIHGMCVASMLLSSCNIIYVRKENDEDEIK